MQRSAANFRTLYTYLQKPNLPMQEGFDESRLAEQDEHVLSKIAAVIIAEERLRYR